MKTSLVVLILCGVVAIAKANTYQTFEENGKVGLKDETGKIVLPPAFEALGWSDGNFSVIGETTGYRQQGLWGIVNLKKEFVTPAEFESLTYAGGDCLIARKKINAVATKTGCLNLKGESKIPFAYDGIIVQGLRAIVFTIRGAHYQYGLVDLDHRMLLPMEYKYIRPLGTLRYAVENRDNKIALFSDDGKPLTSFSIDSISEFYKNYAILYQDQQEGLIARDGTMKLEIKYSKIIINTDGSVKARRPTEWLLLNVRNEIVQQISADEIIPHGDDFLLRNGKAWGLADRNFKPILALRYQYLSHLNDGSYLVKLNNKVGVIEKDGKNRFAATYDSLIYENHTFRSFERGSGWQLLDENGKPLTSKYYQELSPGGTAGWIARSRDYYGWIDAQGRERIHCVFDSVAPPVNNLLVVKFKGQYGIINTAEDWVVAPQVYRLRVINPEVYLQQQPDNNFIKSLSGNIIYFTPYPLSFDRDIFTECLPDGNKRRMNYSGQLIAPLPVPENVKEVFPESEGFRGIKKDDRYGFVDKKGKLRIANRYDSIGEFHEGLASIKLIGKWGFVNTGDQIVINPNFDRPGFFLNEIAIVSRNQKFGLINPHGQMILSLRYDRVERLPDNKFLLEASSRFGLADARGIVQVEPRFNTMRLMGNNTMLVSQDGKFGLITEQGLSVIPILYDEMTFSPAQQLFLAKKNSYWKEIEIK
jgi:hypothetical protein